MNASNVAHDTASPIPTEAPRSRLVRDQSAVERFGLRPGEMYRVAYVAGASQSRRVSRSLVIFQCVSQRRRWDGQPATCLDFVLPQGRGLSLLESQLVDARPAGISEGGQWILLAQDRARRRLAPPRRGAHASTVAAWQ